MHQEDRSTLRMGVNIPGSDHFAMIGFNSLPFGAVGSVAGFLRKGQALWFLGYFGLGLMWSAFYDDFTLLSRRELENSLANLCSSFLEWNMLRRGTSASPSRSSSRLLGLRWAQASSPMGWSLSGHTQSRRDELGEQLGAVLEEGSMSSKEAERMRGRMILFEGFTFGIGRVANSSVKTISRFCVGSNAKKKLDLPMKRSLEFLRSRVAAGPPLRIERALHSTWLVFTDGACEQDVKSGSVGGVIFSPCGVCLNFFGESVPRRILDGLFSSHLWGEMFAHSQVVFYIDNESARMAFIRGDGSTGPWCENC